MTDETLTRLRLLQLGLALPPFVALGDLALDAVALAAPLRPTAACDDGDDDLTEAQTEGPYFKTRTPLRRAIVPSGAAGTRLTVTGRVLTTRCRPVARALLEFWQCDARGVYDNTGYRFRGHQFTDAQGRYTLRTVVPGLYPGRTRHIHVKVQAPGRPVLTTQLYFPREPRNRSDSIFDSGLLLERWRRVGARRTARFDFVLDAG